MQPEKKQRVEEDYTIIDEREEMARARKEKERLAREKLCVMQPYQREELKSQLSKHVRDCALGCGMILFFTLLYSLSGEGQRAENRNVVGWVWLIVGGACLVWGGLVLRKWIRATQDLRSGVVEFAEGKVYLDVVRSRWRIDERPGYKLQVGGETFHVPKDLFLSLNNRQEYRVYYSPRSHYVLGAEPL